MSVNSEVDLDKLLPYIVDRAVEFTKTERGILLLYDAHRELVPTIARDASGRDLPLTVKFSRTITTAVATKGEATQRVISGDDEPQDLATSVLELKLRSVMCAPLTLRGKTLGAVYVDSRAASREFTATDVQFFHILGQHIAASIEKARLVREELEKQRMQVSLEVARDIQKHFIPHGAQSIPGFDLAVRSWSADEANGDYCDVLPVSSGKFGIVVGDVSGHGIGPALLMSSARARLRTLLRYNPAIDGLLENLNEGLSEDMEPGRFVTLFYGELDERSRMLVYANAGHPPAMLVRGSSGAIEELGKTGPALGLSTEAVYSTPRRIRLEPDDVVLFYTDGLIEAMNSARDTFGVERVGNLVREHRREGAGAVLDRLGQEVVTFTGPTPQDDVTLIAIRAVG